MSLSQQHFNLNHPALITLGRNIILLMAIATSIADKFQSIHRSSILLLSF